MRQRSIKEGALTLGSKSKNMAAAKKEQV